MALQVVACTLCLKRQAATVDRSQRRDRVEHESGQNFGFGGGCSTAGRCRCGAIALGGVFKLPYALSATSADGAQCEVDALDTAYVHCGASIPVTRR